MKAELGFYETMGEGLWRDFANIQCKVHFALDPLAVSNHQKYSVEDLHKLKSLVDRHGMAWKKISVEMGR